VRYRADVYRNYLVSSRVLGLAPVALSLYHLAPRKAAQIKNPPHANMRTTPQVGISLYSPDAKPRTTITKPKMWMNPRRRAEVDARRRLLLISLGSLVEGGSSKTLA
jgi:hypothetical protein